MAGKLSSITNLPYVEGGFMMHNIGKKLNVRESSFRFFYHKPYANDWNLAKLKAREKIQKGGENDDI